MAKDLKMCLACNEEFEGGDILTCPRDGTALISLVTTDPMYGRVLNDRYRVVEAVWRNRSGIAYQAEAADGSGEKFRITMLSWMARDAKDVAHVSHRLNQLKTLDHAAVLPIVDSGACEHTAFYVSPWWQPRVLFESADHVLPYDVAIAVLRALAEGLEHCHSRGTIHSNLSPEAIFVFAEEQNSFSVRLGDFMVAQSRFWTGSGYTCVDFNKIFGNARYMSPEQLMGKPVEAASDIYSFGILMYELLTGKVPFRGSNELQTASKHMQEEPPRFRDITSRGGVPREIEMVARRCLGKSPDDRFGSMRDVVNALGS